MGTSKHNLFDFINEKETVDSKNITTIIFKDKHFDEIEIPKRFSAIKKCKKLKDLKYYQLSELLSQLEKHNRDLFESYIKLVCKGLKSFKSCFEKTITDLEGFSVVLRRSNGEKLEEIGNEKGISRERVRQIEKNALESIYVYVITYLYVINGNNELDNSLFYNYNEIFKFIKNSDLIMVIEYTLLKIKDDKFSNYDDDFKVFINLKKKSIITKIKGLIKLDNSFDFFDAYTKINNTLTFNHNIIDFSFDIYKAFLVNKGYTLKDNIAQKQVVMSSNVVLSNVIKEEFPDGIVIDDEGIKELKRIIAEKGMVDVKINSALANIDESSPELIIWGKKKRIHIDNVKVKDKKVQEIVLAFEELFVDLYYLLLDDVFNKIEDKLKNTPINDKYKLYGFLKYHLKDKYYFKKMGVRKKELKESKLSDMVKNYIESNDMCTIDDITNDLNIASSSAYAMIRDNSLIVCIDNKYTLATKLNITNDDLELIYNFLIKDVNDYYIHKENFYALHESDWKRIRITDDSMLYHICKYYFGDEFNFYIPYIQNKKYNYAITFKKIMNDYLENNNYIIDINKAQKDLSYVIASKDFSLIYYMRSFDFKPFRMEIDRLTLYDNIKVDDITKYMIKQRLDEFFGENKYAFEKSINNIAKGLYYYVDDEKCYMNYYSLSSYIEQNLEDYFVVTSLGINNYTNIKYAIAKEDISYTELVYRKIREEFKDKENSKLEIYKYIRNNNILVNFPSNLFKDLAEYTDDKIIFKK